MRRPRHSEVYALLVKVVQRVLYDRLNLEETSGPYVGAIYRRSQKIYTPLPLIEPVSSRLKVQCSTFLYRSSTYIDTSDIISP